MALKYPLSLVIRAVDRVTGPLDQINKRLEGSAGKLTAPFRRLGDRVAALSRATGLPKVVDGFKGVGAAAGALGSKVLGIGAALAGMGLAGGVALLGIVRSAQEAGGRLKNMSERTGLSVDAFAELEFAAKRAGVENEAFAAGMEHFNKALSEARRGTGPLAGLLGKVGVRLQTQLKGAKSNEEAFDLLAKAMGKIQNPGRRAELAAAAFGKAGVGMVLALKDGPEGIASVREEFRKLVGSQAEFAARSQELGDAFDNLELSMLGLRNAAAGALMPALTALSEAATKLITDNRDKIQKWAEETGAAIKKWVDDGGLQNLIDGLKALADRGGKLIDKLGGLETVLGAVGVAMAAPILGPAVTLGVSLVGLGKEIVLLSFRFGTLLVGALGRAALGLLAFNFGPMLTGFASAAKAVWAFNVALFANPIGLLVGLVVLLAGVVYANWTPLFGFFKDLWQTIKFNAVEAWNAISGVVSDVWGGIVDSATRAWEKIKPVIDAVRTGLGILASPSELISLGATEIQHRFYGEPVNAQRALPAPGGGEARVTVDFTGLPRGATVTPARGNSAPLDLNLGYAMPGVGQ